MKKQSKYPRVSVINCVSEALEMFKFSSFSKFIFSDIMERSWTMGINFKKWNPRREFFSKSA
jgi:hypothetical protein